MTEVQTASQSAPMSARNWLLLVLLGAIWGGSFFFARIAVAQIAPLGLVLLRVSIAALALHAYLLLRGLSFRPVVQQAGPFLALACLNNVIPFSLIFAGQTETGAELAAVLNATTPFWTLLVANRLTRDETLNTNKLAGVAIGIAGTAVMVGPDLLAEAGGPVWPKLAFVGASLSYAFALVLAKRLRAVPPALIATGQLTASTLIMVPIVLMVNGPAALMAGTPGIWAAVLALALVSTAFAYILYFRILASAGAMNASLVTLLVPASAILLGMIFLDERLRLFEAAGIALIGLGLVVIDGRLLKQRRPHA